MIQFLLIIPVLGALKNYVKYKRVSVLLFLINTIYIYIIYSYLRLLNYKNKIILTIVNERIFMFIYKIIYSLLTDSYHKNKLKYIKIQHII